MIPLFYPALLAVALAAAPAPPAIQGEIAPTQCLAIGPVGRSGRSAAHTDAIEAQIVAGTWRPPREGNTVALPDGSVREWRSLAVGSDGWFSGSALRGGYAYVAVPSDSERVMILEASGHAMVYVNGEPRAGDVYATGYVRLPVLLRAGTNHLLFQAGRGRLRVRLVRPRAPAMLDGADATLPDLIAGRSADCWGALVAINATAKPMSGLVLRASWPGGSTTAVPLPTLPPLSTRKVGFRIRGRVPAKVESVPLRLQMASEPGRGTPIDSASLTLRVRKPGQTYKVTFRSQIDGSVQYYAVNPAWPPPVGSPAPALFLSLHGAGVEAIGQADAYEPKSWGYLVAPTNRRPYGFDWEDWGRLDAMEVLALAQSSLHTDPARTYLTGHSMGGHGTWQVGVTFPDRFAAIGPSAGWISFASYGGGREPSGQGGVAGILERAASPSDTLALERNYLNEGVYVLHGDADDNVPVTEARTMRSRLSAFHHDFVYHEQPGAGHWWDVSDEPGADCVDWPPMFDLFAHHAIPPNNAVRQVEFATASPGVSARCYWVTIEAQIHSMELSSVSVRCDPGRRRFVGTTTNVARLALGLGQIPAGQPIDVELDGQIITGVPWPSPEDVLRLARGADGKWAVAGPASPSQKTPARCGPFKDAFRHRFVLVYGTHGTAEENAWAFAKARFDAESFWYRGNGSVDVLADTQFRPDEDRDRGVILYGNADTNSAWKALLADSPIQVRRGVVRVGEREERGADLACLFVRPRPGSAVASVAAVAGTGPAGMRLTDRLSYFTAGAAYPDWIVLGPEMLSKGIGGVRGAGFFGNDWGLASGDSAWRQAE